MTAGYSGTPLARKLGIKAGMTVVVLGAPDDFDDLLAPVPDDVRFRRRAQGRADLVVSFHTRRRHLESRLPAVLKTMTRDGGWWVCWPKRSSGVASDITEDTVREVALPIGLVDVKVCAVDETWSGLRVVWRRELR